jgi:RNA polymerase sigma factor (sigma-70 family)
MSELDPPDPPSSDSTVDVLERARAGDRSAAIDLLMRAIPGVRRWAHGRTPAPARGSLDTEDMIQSGVIRTLRQIDSI